MAELYTTNQLAKLFGVVPTTVIDWIEHDKLVAFKTLGGHRRITHDAVLEFLDRNQLVYPPAFAAGVPAIVLLAADTELLGACEAALRADSFRSRVFVDRHPIDALIRIGAERPRVVVFASPLAGLDTLEFCARLRANKSVSGVRLVAIGDPADAAEEAALLATEADAYLTRAEAARGLAVTCDSLLGRLGQPSGK